MNAMPNSHAVVWWLAEYVLVHGRVPSKQRIAARWRVSRATAYRYRREAQDQLDQRQSQRRQTQRSVRHG